MTSLSAKFINFNLGGYLKYPPESELGGNVEKGWTPLASAEIIIKVIFKNMGKASEQAAVLF